MSTKFEFATWFKSLPGVSSWFGNIKIDLWAAGSISSKIYDQYYTWYGSGNSAAVLADVQRHTGTIFTAPQQSVSDAYVPIVKFLSDQLAWQQAALVPNQTNPLAEATVQDEISRTSLALNYYKSLQR